jgi:hypothetical protein
MGRVGRNQQGLYARLDPGSDFLINELKICSQQRRAEQVSEVARSLRNVSC